MVKKVRTNQHGKLPGMMAILVLVLLLSPLRPQITFAASSFELRITSLSLTQIRLDWTDYSSNEQGFRVEKKVDGGSFYYIGYLGSNSSTYTDYGLSVGHTYAYRVSIVNADGSTAVYTHEVHYMALAVTTPNALTLTPVSPTRIDLAWTYPGGSPYRTVIERRAGVSGTWSPIAIGEDGTNRYSDTGLQQNVQYFYRIKAVAGSGVYSPTYPGDYGTWAYTLLGKPVGLSGYAISSSQVLLNWSDVSGETGFVIERKSGNGQFTVVGSIGQNTTSWYDYGLIPGNLYTYRVKATNYYGGYSEYSDEVVVGTTYLAAPSGFLAESVTGKGVELSWNDNTQEETGYEIWRKTGTAGTWEKYTTVERNTGSFADTGIQPHTQYFYRVRAVAGYVGSCSAFTTELGSYTLNMAAPEVLDYRVSSSTAITLTWKDKALNESGFRVEQRAGENGPWLVVASVPANTTRYSIGGLTPEVVYWYRVSAYNSTYNASADSGELKVASRAIPAAPTGLSLQAVSSARMKLQWEDRTGSAEGYIIERKKAGGSYVVAARLTDAVKQYTDTGLQGSTVYTYRIKAVNKAGNSTYSRGASLSTRADVTFKDLGNYSWAKPAIEDLASRGALLGRDEKQKLFVPGAVISRAELVAMTVRALGLDAEAVGSFADMKGGEAFYKEMMIAKNLGIIASDRTNRIYPTALINRQEAAVILYRAVKAAGREIKEHQSSELDAYADQSGVTQSAQPAMAWILGEKIMEATQVGAAPQYGVARAYAAVLVYRIVD